MSWRKGHILGTCFKGYSKLKHTLMLYLIHNIITGWRLNSQWNTSLPTSYWSSITITKYCRRTFTKHFGHRVSWCFNKTNFHLPGTSILLSKYIWNTVHKRNHVTWWSSESLRKSCMMSDSAITLTAQTFSRYSSNPLRRPSSCCSDNLQPQYHSHLLLSRAFSFSNQASNKPGRK